MNKSFRIEEYLNEKFNSVIKLKESVHLNDQHNLLELKIAENLKNKLKDFYQNLQKIIISLIDKKTQLNLKNNFLTETLGNLKKNDQKKINLIKKIIEEEVNRIETLNSNPDFIYFFKTLSHLAKSEDHEKSTDDKSDSRSTLCEEQKDKKKFDELEEKKMHFKKEANIKYQEKFQSKFNQKIEDHKAYQEFNNNEEVNHINGAKKSENDLSLDIEILIENDEHESSVKKNKTSHKSKKNESFELNKKLIHENQKNFIFIKLNSENKEDKNYKFQSFFYKFVKKSKTLEEILRKFCPKIENLDKKYMKIGKKNHAYGFTEEYISKISKEYEEKFQRVLAYVDTNEKFPNFSVDPKICEKLGTMKSQFELFPFMKYIFGKNFFYERNLTLVSNFQFQYTDQWKEKLYRSLLIHLEYQKEYLVLPCRAAYFNKFSTKIFCYLKEINSGL